MATTTGCDREAFWSMKEVSRESGAPYRFNDWMSGKRFKDITKHLCLTSLDPPQFKDRFWEVRQMIRSWNLNMRQVFTPSWVSCLDESMSIWFNRWTCPGWMFVPRKPHPFGNEYHTVACGLSNILYQMELVEGKDSPEELSHKEQEKELGKTGSMMMRILKPILGTAKVVILDSGFCVLHALVALKKAGVFASAVI